VEAASVSVQKPHESTDSARAIHSAMVYLRRSNSVIRSARLTTELLFLAVWLWARLIRKRSPICWMN
jgi:hypothetical protein